MIPQPLAYNHRMRKIAFKALLALIVAVFSFSVSGCGSIGMPASSSSAASSASASVSGDSYAEEHLTGGEYVLPDGVTVDKKGEYTDKDHVALYIHTYGDVPSNYVTKTKARKAGWVNTEGNLWEVLPGKSIGGGGFYNDDGTMPDAPGREWFECDIDYDGGFRNSKRLVYSNDGLIYYTDDHYKTFQRLY